MATAAPAAAPLRPLEQIRRETKAANRAPHLRKANFVGADPIDALDDVGVGGAYHHGGPYDAVLAPRNRDARTAPVAATMQGNLAALRATPREHVEDALARHVPLQGTASVPPGLPDLAGRRMSYEEGADLMREPDAEGGAYKRWDQVQYHPDDLKGKGEPSYTIERRLKEQEAAARGHHARGLGGTQLYEMQPSPTKAHYSPAANGAKDHRPADVVSVSGAAGPSDDYYYGRSRSGSAPKKIAEGIKRRIGSIRRSKRDADEA
ncbi:hypothetical protein F4780DRAFT_299137 [Xylariomycetidae sp. FL0641]|nr:hypothetical protein F4780DRAFT_299137 [Xylariomycetidae sp. FL0641]